MKRTFGLVVMMTLLVGAIAQAETRRLSFAMQTTEFTAEPGQALEFEIAHSGEKDPRGFIVRIGTTVLKDFALSDLTLISAGRYVTKPGTVPAFTAAQIGRHTLTLTAYNLRADGTKREGPGITRTVVVDWTTGPPAPTEWIIRAATSPGGPVEELRVFNLEAVERIRR